MYGLGHHLLQSKIELGQTIHRPTSLEPASRWFAHHEQASYREEGSSALGRDTWSGEASGQDEIELVPQRRPAARRLCPLSDHLDASGEVQAINCVLQERRPAFVRLHQHPSAAWPGTVGQGKPRNTAARPELQDPGRRLGHCARQIHGVA